MFKISQPSIGRSLTQDERDHDIRETTATWLRMEAAIVAAQQAALAGDRRSLAEARAKAHAMLDEHMDVKVQTAATIGGRLG